MVLRTGFLAMALAAAGLANGVAAKDYSCAAWTPASAGIADLRKFSVLKRMIVFQDSGAQKTARMFFGSLRRNTYIEDDSAIVVYGRPVKRSGGVPEFGRTITVQRLYYDPKKPVLVSTICEAQK